MGTELGFREKIVTLTTQGALSRDKDCDVPRHKLTFSDIGSAGRVDGRDETALQDGQDNHDKSDKHCNPDQPFDPRNPAQWHCVSFSIPRRNVSRFMPDAKFSVRASERAWMPGIKRARMAMVLSYVLTRNAASCYHGSTASAVKGCFVRLDSTIV